MRGRLRIIAGCAGNTDNVPMGGVKMKNNNCIKCTVDNCAYHCKTQAYCSLPEIKVGCTCGEATDCQGTECASFRLDSNTTGAY